MGRFDERATRPMRGMKDFFRWKLLDRGSPAPKPLHTTDGGPAHRIPNPSLLRETTPSLTWIGHATFAFRLGGLLIATDPIWSQRISGAVPRLKPPGLPLRDLPLVDVVTVSHNHRDHLDMPTLEHLGPQAMYVTPLGNGALLKKAGATRIVELDWWQTHRQGKLEITLVPARHWSMRVPWDRNDALWGGFVYRSHEGTAYHSGDTAYFDGFKEIHERLGPIDWAMLPIGAYEPRWFMESQHMNPEEAGQAFLDLNARYLVAMHWGTFTLTDEPVGEPPQRIRKFFRDHHLDESRLWIMDIGENRALEHREMKRI